MKIVQEDDIGALLKIALLEIINYGSISNPRGLRTLELHPLALILNSPRKRFIDIPTTNYPLIILKQLHFIIDKYNQPLFQAYEDSFLNQKPSAAFLYSDINNSNIFRQLESIFSLFTSDIETRQAVIRFDKNQNNFTQNSITLCCQFIYRHGRLDAITYMRSNELWKGLVTDLHYLIFMQELLASWLNVELGTYTHIIGSAHIYESNIASANDYILSKTNLLLPEYAFKSSKSDSIDEVKKFLIIEKEIRTNRKVINYNFSNPYFNFCLKEIIKVNTKSVSN